MKVPIDEIRKVIEYLDDEKTNYENAGRPKNHIYLDILKIKRWVKQKSPSER